MNEETNKHRVSLLIALVGALFALVLSSLSTIHHIRLKNEGFLRESYCAISEKVNCDIVNASSYSEFLGVPIALWGVAFY